MDYEKYEPSSVTFTPETVASNESTNECSWRTFVRTQRPASGGRIQYIDDVDTGGEASNVSP